MASKFLGALLAGLCLMLAACTPQIDQKYLREGIGSDLDSVGLAKQTELQESYLGFMCQQAGVPINDGADGFPRCDYGSIGPKGWHAVITAGMNDIDRRCDSYLAWLDNKRRTKEPLIRQISNVDLATQNIMGFSGADTAAISIVGVAFGLLRSSVENYHSRLLLVVEGSTINSIVLSRRNAYRQRDVEGDFLVRYKPDVVHHIRSYLRLCLPFTIEMDINDLSTLRARGIDTPGGEGTGSVTEPDEALGEGEVVPPPARRTARRFAPPPRARERVRSSREVPFVDKPVVEKPINPATPFEETLGSADVSALQERLCVASDGVLGDATRDAIRIFEITHRAAPVNGQLTAQEGALLQRQPVCDRAIFNNYYERSRLAGADKVLDLKRRMNALLPAERNMPLDATLNSQTRDAVAELKGLCGIQDPAPFGVQDITPEFLIRVGFGRPESEAVDPCVPAPQ